MKRNKLLKSFVLGIAFSGMLLLPVINVSAADTKKAVYHVDFGNGKRMMATLRNIQNLVNYYTNKSIDYDVRVVSNSAGVQFMINSVKGTKFAKNKIPKKIRNGIAKRMKGLADGYDVKFEQCIITLQRTNISKKRLKKFVKTISSGQVRIVELQSQGFAYIKVK